MIMLRNLAVSSSWRPASWPVQASSARPPPPPTAIQPPRQRALPPLPLRTNLGKTRPPHTLSPPCVPRRPCDSAVPPYPAGSRRRFLRQRLHPIYRLLLRRGL